MLEGINVLNKITEKTELPNWWWIGIIILAAIIMIIGIAWSIIEHDSGFLGITLVLGLLVAFTYILVISADCFQKPTGKYTYQVTIDNTVDFKDFNDNYNVIKQEGEIYYIREK